MTRAPACAGLAGSAVSVVELEGEFLGRESLGEESVEITDLDRPVQPHQEDPDLGVELGQSLSVGRGLMLKSEMQDILL